jgi:large subunit ribosomal protein L25
MKKHTLSATKRDVKNVKPSALRRQGQIPATVYGKKIASESLSLQLADFMKVYNEAHETGLVELMVDGAMKPVLIHTVQKNPVKGEILHVELHQVDLKEKVHANVPIVLTGESPAVAQKVGVVLTLVSEVEVEALPTHLPEKLDVSIDALAEVGQELKVSDIAVGSDITILTDASVVVARVGELVSKAAEEQAAADAAVAEASATEGATGDTAAENAEATTAEQKADEEKKPEAK